MLDSKKIQKHDLMMVQLIDKETKLEKNSNIKQCIYIYAWKTAFLFKLQSLWL